MGHCRGVPAHAVEVLVREGCGFISEELTTFRERNDAIRRLGNPAWTCVGTRQLLHSQRATNPPGHGVHRRPGHRHIGGIRDIHSLRSGLRSRLLVLGVRLQHEIAHALLCGRVRDGT